MPRLRHLALDYNSALPHDRLGELAVALGRLSQVSKLRLVVPCVRESSKTRQ